MAKYYLSGFMAAGKSTMIKEIADAISFYPIDLDQVIKEKENKRIVDIFLENGEEYFRTLETKYLKDIVKEDNIIVALGGGTVLNDENVHLIKDNGGIIFFIDTNLDTMLLRIKNQEKRPLIKSQGKEEAKKLYFERLEKYKETADYIIKDNNIQEIINIIRENSCKS